MAATAAATRARPFVDVDNHVLTFRNVTHNIVIDHNPYAVLAHMTNADNTCWIDVLLLGNFILELPGGTLSQVDCTVVVGRMLSVPPESDIEACDCEKH